MPRNSRGVSKNDSVGKLEVGECIALNASLLGKFLDLGAISDDISLDMSTGKISSDLNLSCLQISSTVGEHSNTSLGRSISPTNIDTISEKGVVATYLASHFLGIFSILRIDMKC